MKKLLTIICLCVSIAFLASSPALSETDWPQKPIRMTIPFGAGGTTDIIVRMLGSILEKDLGVPVVCENKPGGGGSVAAGLGAAAKPDGYKLFAMVTAAGITNPQLQSLPYNPLTDFTLFNRVVQWHYGLVVPTDSEFKTFKDLLEYSKANPGKVSYGISGVGTSQHLVMEWFRINENAGWKSIPFKGGTEAVTACMGGHVTAMAGVTEWLPQVRSGEMRLLAIFDAERMAEFPDVPTVKEMGYDIVAPSFMAIAGPKGIPQPIVEKLDHAVAKAMADPQFVELTDKILVKRAYLDHQAFQKEFEAEYKSVGELLKKAGLIKK